MALPLVLAGMAVCLGTLAQSSQTLLGLVAVGALIALSVTLGAILHSRRSRGGVTVARLQQATDNAMIGVWEWDLRNNTFRFSDSYYRMLGYEPGELRITNESWELVCHPEDLPGEREALERHFAGETERYEHEHRIRTKSDEWLWVKDTGRVIERDASGKPSRMLGVHIDIQTLRDAQASAEAAKRAQAEFFANMSHEIRTPLTAILGYVDLMDTDDRAARSEARAVVHNNADVLLTIIDDLLDVSKLQASKMRLERVDMDPRDVVGEVVSLMRPRAERVGLSLIASLEGDVPTAIHSDRCRVRQILLNLVGNAIKFTERGGVRVSIACDADRELLEIRVSDTGIGMTPEQLEGLKKFDGFFQADASTSRLYGGTGLGVRIVSELVELLGGTLDVSSRIGEGTTFIATIASGDLADRDWHNGSDGVTPTTIASAHTPQNDGASLDGTLILLVEDGVENQRLIGHHLKKAGASVHIEANGLAAVEWLASRSSEVLPDMVLMDMQMPVMDGVTATAELRKRAFTLPIIALTANAGADDRARCLGAGCDDVLTKPVDFPGLIADCAAWCAGEKRRDAAA